MDKKKQEKIRPPTVTLMGHVDHGKTTLLDTIRKTNIVAGEHGGITQHIGAYQITFNKSPITFIDTPGHAAFEKMRSRGVDAADIVILVIAANDGVKPQTREAIKHIKKAQKPLIVALTKVDLPNLITERIKKDLQKDEVLLEEFGGDVPLVEVSASKNKGIDDLLEMVQLVWQISPETSFPHDFLEAVVVEAFLDKNRGPVVTAIVKKGTLKIGQKLTVDDETISVKALINDRGENINEALPGDPVEILGFKKLLGVGSIVHDTNILESSIVQPPATLAEIIAKSQLASDRFKIIIKADVVGSLDAIVANLPERILIVSSGIGEINSTDISFAKVASAPILAFNVKVNPSVRSQADRERVVIKSYRVIYDLLTEIEEVTESFETAKQKQKITGQAKIVAEFDIEGKKIAGVVVTSGKLKLGDRITIGSGLNSGEEIKISSLKKYKKEVEFASQGQECGIGFTPNIDFKVGDIIESLG